jgi:hypothetical protein
VATLLDAMEILLEPKPGGEEAFRNLYRHYEEPALRAAMEDCGEFRRLEESGYQDALRSRHGHLRRYFPAFLKLPFHGEPGTKELLAGITLAREINQGKQTVVPLDAPVRFVPSAWRAALKHSDGAIDKRLGEISLSLAVRDVLRSGDLYLPQSRHHVSFSNLIYDEQRWEPLKAANAALVNYHHQLPLRTVWGEGLISSSDGQRFGIQQSSLLASFYSAGGSYKSSCHHRRPAPGGCDRRPRRHKIR